MSAVPVATARHPVPLCVDLDGTLIKTDLLWESCVGLLARKPWLLFALPFWLLRGRAVLKQELAARVALNPATLPYHAPLIEFLRAAKRDGTPLFLVTASDVSPATRVAEHLGIFDGVLASDGKLNLRGRNKARVLVERFGQRGFDYAGNSSVDLDVWAEAREAIVVNAGSALAEQAARRAKPGRVFPRAHSFWRRLVQTLRPHQWTKNLIVFVPLITAHQIGQRALLFDAFLASIAFCLCASGAYVFNDLLDLEADRQHPVKRFRPLASGELPLPVGLGLFPVLLISGLAVAFQLSSALAGLLGAYFAITLLYSVELKRAPLLDVFILAGLYTSRIIAGHVATGVEYSVWLLVFSMFIFLSLALVKRFTELQTLRQQNVVDAKRRGYTAGDLELVATLGIVTGCLAVLVLALYVSSEKVVVLYRHPPLLLFVCPMFLYWIARVWLMAHRGQMHSDPVMFALKDRASYAVGVLTLVVLWLATGR